MLLKTYQKGIVNEYGIEFIKEHACSPFIAIEYLNRYAREMYMNSINSNEEYSKYKTLQNSKYCYDQEADAVYKILEISPFEIKLQSPCGLIQMRDQNYVNQLIGITPNEVKTRLGFLALSKNKEAQQNVIKIEGSDLKSRNVLLFTGDLNKPKPVKNGSFKDHRIMNIYDFLREYDVVIYSEYLDFVA
jgi:hypothetical protein